METAAFEPPTPRDYDNVVRFNRAWLALPDSDFSGAATPLVDAPFLLFSVREQDVDWWQQALSSQNDWVQGHQAATPPAFQLQAAVLGFLWQLACRNAYAARLLTGATLSWCEMLAAQPLMAVIERVATRAELLVPRFPLSHLKLRPLQLVALQALLTDTTVDVYTELPAAACKATAPFLRVAEKRD